MTKNLSSVLLVAALGSACFPVFAQKAHAPSLCAASEQAVFSCTLKGPSHKMVALCASSASTAREKEFHYAFGRPSKIELRYPASGNGAITYTRLFYAGGTFGHAHSFRNEGYKYILYSIEGTNNRSGLLVQREGQLRASSESICKQSTLAETQDPELLRATSEWTADPDIEGHNLPSTR